MKIPKTILQILELSKIFFFKFSYQIYSLQVK